MRTCVHCGCEIPEGRIKALPNTQTCTAHSNVAPKKGIMVYDHKTAPEMQVVDESTAARVYELTSREPFKRSGKKHG